MPFQVLLVFRAPLVIRWYDAEVSFCSRNEHALKRVEKVFGAEFSGKITLFVLFVNRGPLS